MPRDVRVVTHIEGEIVQRTKEVDGPRGWGEGAIRFIDIEKHDDETLLVHFHGKPDEDELLVSRQLIEAALALLEKGERRPMSIEPHRVTPTGQDHVTGVRDSFEITLSVDRVKEEHVRWTLQFLNMAGTVLSMDGTDLGIGLGIEKNRDGVERFAEYYEESDSLTEVEWGWIMNTMQKLRKEKR